MDLTQVLLADLRDLAIDATQASYTQTTIALLHRHLNRLIPSAFGATITITFDTLDSELRLDVVTRHVAPSEIRATLRIPLTALDTRTSTEGWIDLHAAERDAFDTLNAQLTLALRAEGRADRPDEQHPRLVSPPDTPLTPGLSGFSDFTQVNLALGILWNRGLDFTQARTELQRRADHGGTDLAGAARILLNSW